MKIAVIVNGRYADSEIKARENYFQSKSSRGTHIGLFFPEQFPLKTSAARAPTPEDLTSLAVDIVNSAKAAEKQDYDAVVVYNSYDPGLDAAMSMVKIPVIGSGRAAFSIAAMIADRISIIAPYTSFIPMTYRLASSLGLAARITPIRALDIPVRSIAERKQEATDKFVELVKKAVADGGQVIFPQGLNSLSVHIDLNKLGVGCPVVDPVPLAIHYAEMFVSLGVTQSKLAYP